MLSKFRFKLKYYFAYVYIDYIFRVFVILNMFLCNYYFNLQQF